MTFSRSHEPVFWDPSRQELLAELGLRHEAQRQLSRGRRMATAMGDLGTTWAALDEPWANTELWTGGCWSSRLRRYCIISTTANAVSTDGYNWVRSSTPSVNWEAVDYSPSAGVFVKGAGSNSPSVNIGISVDGLNWEHISKPLASRKLYYIPELDQFITVSSGSSDALGIELSSDGRQWLTVPYQGFTGSWRAVAYSPSLKRFAAVEEGAGREMWSDDGLNWSLSSSDPTPGIWLTMVWVEKLKLFVAVNGSTTASTQTYGAKVSPDGKVWTPVPWFNTSLRCLVWADTRGLLIGASVAGDAKRLATSPDGTNWTLVAQPALASASYGALVWNPDLGQLLALGKGGGATAPRIIVSP